MSITRLLRIVCLLIVLTLLLGACGTSAPSAKVAQQTPNGPATTATATPRPAATRTATPRPTTRPTAIPTATTQPDPQATSSAAGAPSPTPTPPNATAVVTNGGNVRLLPVTGEPLDQVHAHETVALVGKNADGTWYLLMTPRNVTGWVSATLLRIDPPNAAQVPVVAATTQGTRAPAAESTGWTTHTFDQSTIQLPATWQAVPLNKADLERSAKALETQNPALANAMRQFLVADQLSLARFLALDASQGAMGGANVNVMVAPRPSGTIPADLVSQITAELKSRMPGMKLISGDGKHQVNGLPAVRVVFDVTNTASARSAAPLRGVQWYVIGAAQVFIITVIGPADDALITVADRIGQSFTTRDAAEGGATSGDRRQVINGGNLRQVPQVRPSNVIGQVCPGDQVALLDQSGRPGWVAVRIVVTGPDCDPTRVAAGTEGWVSTSLLGPVPQDGSAALPPSLLITKLVPFTHKRTGITGLRPENWTLFETGPSFQISSSPEAPDGFFATLTESTDYGPGGPVELTRATFAEFKRNHAAGPAPEIHEEQINPDGSGVLLATISGQAQASSQSVRMTVYARTTITPRGVLMAIAIVPADQFPRQEALVRQMVDSVRITE